MKMKKILAMTMAAVLAWEITSDVLVPSMVYAKEPTDAIMAKTASLEDASNEFVDEHATVGTAETASFSSDRTQAAEDQQSKYAQMMAGEKYELEVGESMVIGSDGDGEIYITCVSSDTDLTRAS